MPKRLHPYSTCRSHKLLVATSKRKASTISNRLLTAFTTIKEVCRHTADALLAPNRRVPNDRVLSHQLLYCNRICRYLSPRILSSTAAEEDLLLQQTTRVRQTTSIIIKCNNNSIITIYFRLRSIVMANITRVSINQLSPTLAIIPTWPTTTILLETSTPCRLLTWTLVT